MTHRPHLILSTLALLATLPGALLSLQAQHLPKKKKPAVSRLLPSTAAAAAARPATPAPAPKPAEEEKRSLMTDVPVADTRLPAILQAPKSGPATDATLTPAQKAVRDAERHYQYGKFYIQESKPELARVEFDMAIDVLLDVPENAADRQVSERKFEELIRLIHRYDLEALGSGLAPESPVFVQSPLPEMLDLTFPVDPRLKNRALEIVAASSSQLPLTVNDAVLSYINYFSSERGRRVLAYGLRNAAKYRAMIARILDEEGVPQELIHLAQAESGFIPRAVSPKAACGMWQFVRATGSEYGLNTGRLTDDRLDPEKATRAAARHLRDLYKLTGDWYLAMAAYNCGPACVERAVQRTGYADFWELRARNALPRETSNYVPVILAMAIVSKNLQSYGIELGEPEPALEYDTVSLTADTGLPLAADALDVPVSILRDLNPALLRNVAPGGYDLRVPKSRGGSLIAALESVPESKRASWRMHRIGDGDTLTSIARRYSITPNSIVAANSQLEPAFFEAPSNGEVLLIPALAVPEKAPRTIVRSSTRPTTRGSYRSPAGARKTAASSTVARSSAGSKTSKSLHR